MLCVFSFIPHIILNSKVALVSKLGCFHNSISTECLAQMTKRKVLWIWMQVWAWMCFPIPQLVPVKKQGTDEWEDIWNINWITVCWTELFFEWKIIDYKVLLGYQCCCPGYVQLYDTVQNCTALEAWKKFLWAYLSRLRCFANKRRINSGKCFSGH